MNYSRRQLYALGEPLGDSVTCNKVGGGRIYGGGGGGGGSPGPSTTTSYNTNIPEYAQPYVENMLNAAQAQIYKPDMTGFNEYKPYSNNGADYVAGFSPMQQQAQSSAANMQVPGQYGVAGMQTYGLTNQMANTGRNFQQQATNPNAVQSYMNPYLQASLNPQLQEIQRQYGITGTQEQGQATQAGAFGGSREALMASENQRNKNMAMNQAIGQGYNNAFNNAQSQMNTGAQLGLQGQQAAMGGASQLANIGGQQLNAQQGIANLQNTMGGQQQAQQQQIINQDIQNYATAQQYPYMQMGVLNSMLRGLPMQSTTTASYQAQPSIGMQATGLLGAASSLYGKTAREGGSVDDIKKMKSGGIAEVPGYRYGTLINEPQLESMAGRMDDAQLNKVKGLPGVTPDERNTFDSALINNNYVRSNPEAGQMMAQAGNQAPPPQQQPAPTDRMSGIAQAGGGMFNTMGNPVRAAGGGIIAFAGEGPSAVDDAIAKAEKDAAAQDAANKPKAAPAVVAQKAINKDATKEKTAADFLKADQEMMRAQGIDPVAVGEKGKAYQAALEAQQAGVGNKEDQLERMAKAKAFLSLTQPTGGKNALGQLGSAATEYLGEKATNIKTIEDLKMGNAKVQSEIEAGNNARIRGDIETANKHYDKAAEIKKDLQVANIGLQGHLATAAAAGATQRYAEEQIKRIQAEYKAKTGKDLSYEEAIKRKTEASTTAADSIESQNKRAAQTALQEWKKSVMFTPEYQKMSPEDRIAAENAEYQKILGRFSTAQAAPNGGNTADANAGAPMYATNGKERIVSTDGGKTWNPVKG